METAPPGVSPPDILRPGVAIERHRVETSVRAAATRPASPHRQQVDTHRLDQRQTDPRQRRLHPAYRRTQFDARPERGQQFTARPLAGGIAACSPPRHACRRARRAAAAARRYAGSVSTVEVAGADSCDTSAASAGTCSALTRLAVQFGQPTSGVEPITSTLPDATAGSASRSASQATSAGLSTLRSGSSGCGSAAAASPSARSRSLRFLRRRLRRAGASP